MARQKKGMKQKMAEYAYTKPTMEKKVLDLKKSFSEISSILNDKNKKA